MTGVKRPSTHQPAQASNLSRADLDPASGLEPATTSEVSTKLDLARQFIDMGDPESARHMLDEVLKEGNAAQTQEAQRLVDSLP